MSLSTKHSASTYTPGPWRLTRASGKYTTKYLLRDAKGAAIVEFAGFGSVGNADVHDANARLIAAAPELLEALKRIRSGSDLCECDHATKDCCNNVDYCCEFCISDAAIRKAEAL